MNTEQLKQLEKDLWLAAEAGNIKYIISQ